MKITVLSMTEHEIEVDDRFAPLAHNHPNHIFYPESEELLNELESEIFSQIHLSFVDEKGLNANTQKSLTLTPLMAELFLNGKGAKIAPFFFSK